MSRTAFVGAIDQGTTGTRFMIFDDEGIPVSSAYREHRQIYPQPGWVEHDAEEIWLNVMVVMAEALTRAKLGLRDLRAIGITNQRETTVLWDEATGKPLHNAIVWQDRRTAKRCEDLASEGWGPRMRAATGLPLDPYFSGTKIEWLLQNIPEIRDRKRVLFGNMDSWLIWKLTGAHVTDATNGSRTLLFNLQSLDWDDELLRLFGIPREILPSPKTSSEVYGMMDLSRCGALAQALGCQGERLDCPVSGDLGDQQAALFGQAGFFPGDTKNTYGTGAFLLRNVGASPVFSETGLLSTVASYLSGRPAAYALEGSVFISGAAVQWLRDGLQIIRSAQDTEATALSVPDSGGVVFVPAFAGLGAPHWNPHARGTLVGLTGGTTQAHIVRATLESIAFQTRDVVVAMVGEGRGGEALNGLRELKVDGGAVKNDFLCQFQADILGIPVVRPRVSETTALGAAYAAGLAVGCWKSLEDLARLWRADRRFEPRMGAPQREALVQGWQRAVHCALAWAEERRV